MDEKKRLKRLQEKKLTRKQQKFVKEIVSNDGLITAREAAIRAGFPASSAHTRAWEMQNPNICPHVVREIDNYRAELDEKFEVGYKRHVRDLQKLRDQAVENGAWSAAVQAERLRGMAQGNIYVNKSEIRTGAIDSMSKEDVEKELDRIRQSFEANVIDNTPKEKKQNAEKGVTESGSGAVADSENGVEQDQQKNSIYKA